MVLRNAAVRHGRTLASPVTKTYLRQLTTQPPGTTTATPEAPASAFSTPVEATASWASKEAAKQTSTAAGAPPKKVRTSRRKQAKYVQHNVMSLGIDSAASHQGRSWTDPHQFGGRELTPAEQWKEFKRLRSQSQGLGTSLRKKYMPAQLLADPPKPEDVTLELLMASQTHMGHNTSSWNPANSRYIYGVRQGIHILSLETTAAHLRRAARVVEEVAYRGGIILYVGTRPGQMEIVTKAAQMAEGYHVFTKWAPGSITNRDVMLQGHQTKVVNEKDEKLDGFEMYNLTSRPLVPDLVVCLNPQENYTMLYECGLQTIPTIGIVDTDTDPSWVTYTIPANDDSLRSVGLIGGVLGRAGQRGQRRRKEDADKGVVSWDTSVAVSAYMAQEKSAAIMKRKKVMGQVQQYHSLNEEETKMLNEQNANAQEEITEDAMLSIMGEASAKGAKPASAVEPLQPPTAEDLEAQLNETHEKNMALEKELAESTKQM